MVAAMKRRIGKIKVPAEQVQQLAEKFDENYAELMSDGYRLMGSSGFWQTKQDGITARFVYRKGNARDDGGRWTRTTVITGIYPHG